MFRHVCLVSCDDSSTVSLLLMPELEFVLGVHILCLLLFLCHLLKSWDALVGDVGTVVNSCTKGVLLAALLGEVGLEIEPHNP